jgi:type III secretion protein Q
LQFDLGERTMPLVEVCELQLGQVLDLGRPLSHVVNIRANGALVGTGELIEIGGRIAVSIASLGRQGGSQP